MLQSWRLQLREAEQAYREGRLGEAGRLLRQPPLREFLPARRLLDKVAKKLVRRGREQAADGQTLAGWRDLEAVQSLGGELSGTGALRHDLVERTLNEVVDYLAAGEPHTALARLDKLAAHGPLDGHARRLRQAAQNVREARRLVRRGQFARAGAEFETAASLCPEIKFFEQARRQCATDAETFRQRIQQLHQQVGQSRWSEALATAEELLTLAPQYQPAIETRQRAWEAVGMHLDISSAAGSFGRSNWNLGGQSGARPNPRGSGSMNRMHHANELTTPERRFVLWVDAVGGYLVCPADEIRIGQPLTERRVDVPILADLSRVQTVLHRDGEGYLIEPVRATRLNGHPLESIAPLRDGDLLELGQGVRLRFSRPHPLSGTARLDFLSRHRTQPAVDAVLLMAESCVLGPAANSHVRCPDWSSEVVLFHPGQSDTLFARTEGTFEIDGKPHTGRGPLGRNSHVAGEDFSFSLEAL